MAYNVSDKGKLVDSTGRILRDSEMPVMTWGDDFSITFKFSEGVIAAGDTFVLACDTDRFLGNALCALSNVFTMDTAARTVTFSGVKTNTDKMLNAVNGKYGLVCGQLQVTKYTGGVISNRITLVDCNVFYKGVVYINGANATLLDPNASYTKDELDAIMSTAVEFQFSVDGTSNWHSSQANEDVYLRFRNPAAKNPSWSNKIRFQRTDIVSLVNRAETAATNAESYKEIALTASTASIAAKNDAVNAKDAATSKATEASASATSASQDASMAAQAKADAVNAKSQAVNAKNQAVDAKDESIEAKNNAISAKNDAINAKNAAENAKIASSQYASQANDAKESTIQNKNTVVQLSTEVQQNAQSVSNSVIEVNNAKTQVVNAKNDAINAKNEAVSSATEASSYATSAMSSKNDAVSAKNDAVSAKNLAVSAKDDAIEAKNTAVVAKDDAETSKNNAVSAKNEAITAKDLAVIAKNDSVSASESATTAAAGATAAAAQSQAIYSQFQTEYRAMRLAACSDMGIVIGENAVTLSFADPDNIELNGALMAEWQRTIAVIKNGSFPTSPTDGTIILATSRNPQTDTFPLPSGVTFALKNAYKMNPQEVAVASGNTACVKLFSYTTSEAFNSLAANEFPTYTSYSWAHLADYADAGTFLQHIPLGSALDMENSDYPGHKWLVIDTDLFEPVNQATGHTVSLLSKYVFYGTPADSAETLWAACDDSSAVTGIVYGLNINGSMVTLTEGTHWDAGDTSCTYEGTVYPISQWYEKNPNANYSGGSNYTPQRNDIQWMNADALGNHWFTKRNKWDNCTYVSKVGFMHGIPSTFKACMVETKRTNYVYTSFRKRGIGASVSWNAKAFPLSIFETHATVQGGIQEGKRKATLFQQDSSYLKGYLPEGTTAQIWWLSSAYTNYASRVMYVSAAGSTASVDANYTYCSRPACSFGKVNA